MPAPPAVLRWPARRFLDTPLHQQRCGVEPHRVCDGVRGVNSGNYIDDLNARTVGSRCSMPACATISPATSLDLRLKNLTDRQYEYVVVRQPGFWGRLISHVLARTRTVRLPVAQRECERRRAHVSCSS